MIVSQSTSVSSSSAAFSVQLSRTRCRILPRKDIFRHACALLAHLEGILQTLARRLVHNSSQRVPSVSIAFLGPTSKMHMTVGLEDLE
jgi:hypothetical protein